MKKFPMWAIIVIASIFGVVIMCCCAGLIALGSDSTSVSPYTIHDEDEYVFGGFGSPETRRMTIRASIDSSNLTWKFRL